MIQRPTSSTLRRLARNGESGQSLIILAIGFIALLGFVGIVTDVSLLFVRYSSLRRAVDAAAVAAAGQMRRVADDGGVIGEAASVANLNLAARQLIELYGLDPNNVLVETCRTQNIPRDANGNPILTTDAQRASYYQLCTEDEQKLVRVTAQIPSPTIFMRLLGYPTIVLTESAISQTAVLDVVLMLDVSESMAAETKYSDYETIGLGRRYLPLWIGDFTDTEFAQWATLLTNSMADIRNPALLGTQFPIQSWVPASVSTTQNAPRLSCQVRVSPNSYYISFMPKWLRDEYSAYLSGAPNFTTVRAWFGNAANDNAARFKAFVPSFYYFGCCNDPNGEVDANGNWSF